MKLHIIWANLDETENYRALTYKLEVRDYLHESGVIFFQKKTIEMNRKSKSEMKLTNEDPFNLSSN